MDSPVKVASYSLSGELPQSSPPSYRLKSNKSMNRSLESLTQSDESATERCLWRSRTSFSRKDLSPVRSVWTARYSRSNSVVKTEELPTVTSSLESRLRSRASNSCSLARGLKNRERVSKTYTVKTRSDLTSSQPEPLKLPSSIFKSEERNRNISPNKSQLLSGSHSVRFVSESNASEETNPDLQPIFRQSINDSEDKLQFPHGQFWPKLREVRARCGGLVSSTSQNAPANKQSSGESSCGQSPPDGDTTSGFRRNKSSSALPHLKTMSQQYFDPRQRAALFEKVADKLFDFSSSQEEERLMMKLNALKTEELEVEESRNLKNIVQNVIKSEGSSFSHATHEDEGQTTNSEGTSQFMRLVKKATSVKHVHDLLGKKIRKGKCLTIDQPAEQIFFDDTHLSSPNTRLKAVEQTAEDVRLERKIEAVFSSFARFGRWEPSEVVVSQGSCKIGFHNFVALCEEAQIVTNDQVVIKKIHRIFRNYMDKDSGLISFKTFIFMLPEIATCVCQQPEKLMESVLHINKQGHLWIHATHDSSHQSRKLAS